MFVLDHVGEGCDVERVCGCAVLFQFVYDQAVVGVHPVGMSMFVGMDQRLWRILMLALLQCPLPHSIVYVNLKVM